MKDSSQPSVLIVILNYNTYKLTLQLIERIHTKLDYGNYQIYVIDNCSPNESAKVLQEGAGSYLFYANNKNAGYAAGNNIGIRYGIEHGYKYTWILNNDVLITDENVLRHMVSIMEQKPEIGCVGPKIISRSGTPVAPYVRRRSFWQMTFGIFEDKKFRERNIDKAQQVYRVYGCCMLLRNSKMQEIDCLDERTFLYGEEEILAERMLKAGSYSYYDADVSVIHNESSSVAKDKSKHLEAKKSRNLYLTEYRKFNRCEIGLCDFIAYCNDALRG